MTRPAFVFCLLGLLTLAACDDENATILRGTVVEDGAPGEFFMQGDATKILKCVYRGDGDLPGVNGGMFEYPLVGGGEIRASQGWRATFVQAEYNRTRVVVRDRNGAVNPGLSQEVRRLMDECGRFV